MENSSQPTDTPAILTLRLIRSFEFRNWKPIVIRNVMLSTTTTDELFKIANETIKNSTLPLPFKNYAYDCFKIESHAFASKTNDLLMKLEDDDRLILQPNLTLASQNVKNETEITYFNKNDYVAYKESKLQK